jgi:hypothetical protein
MKSYSMRPMNLDYIYNIHFITVENEEKMIIEAKKFLKETYGDNLFSKHISIQDQETKKYCIVHRNTESKKIFWDDCMWGEGE